MSPEKIETAVKALREIARRGTDPEANHTEADAILLDLIDNQEIRDAFDAIHKWYA